MGTNFTESAYAWMGDPSVFTMDEAALRTRLADILGKSEVERAIGLYRKHYPDAPPSEIFLLIHTERSMRRNCWRMADARAAQQSAPTYVYHFRFQTPYMNGQLHTPHFLEVPLIFQTYGLPGVDQFEGTRPQVDQMAATLSDLWINFARTGVPQAAGVPPWAPYDLPGRETMILNSQSRLESDPDSDLRRFWQSADYQII